MTHQDDNGPAERAQRLRDSAEKQIQGLAGKSMLTATATVASANAQIAIADAVLALVEELREARLQDARQARRERRRG